MPATGTSGSARQGRCEGDEARTSDARGALARQHRDREQAQLLAERKLDVEGLGDEQCSHRHVDIGAVEVEGIAGRDDEADEGGLAAHAFEF